MKLVDRWKPETCASSAREPQNSMLASSFATRAWQTDAHGMGWETKSSHSAGLRAVRWRSGAKVGGSKVVI